MYGEEHYECAHARNNPPPSKVLSQLSHGLFTSRKELCRRSITTFHVQKTTTDSRRQSMTTKKFRGAQYGLRRSSHAVSVPEQTRPSLKSKSPKYQLSGDGAGKSPQRAAPGRC